MTAPRLGGRVRGCPSSSVFAAGGGRQIGTAVLSGTNILSVLSPTSAYVINKTTWAGTSYALSMPSKSGKPCQSIVGVQAAESDKVIVFATYYNSYPSDIEYCVSVLTFTGSGFSYGTPATIADSAGKEMGTLKLHKAKNKSILKDMVLDQKTCHSRGRDKRAA